MRGSAQCDTNDPANRVTVPPQPPPSAETPAGKQRSESRG